MASLTRQQLLRLEGVYKNRPDKVKLTSNWRAIYRQLEVGSLNPSETHLCFITADFERLRQGVLALMGLDLIALDFNVDRLTMASHTHNEKLASIRPEDEYVLVKLLCCLPNPLPISPSSALRMRVDEVFQWSVDLNISTIMVVENLDVFDAIAKANLPLSLQRILVVYRGSGQHSPVALKTLLQHLADKLPVAAFCDFDPAGLQIALTLPGVTHLLLPSMESQALMSTRSDRLNVSAADDFDKQAAQRQFLEEVELGELTAYWIWMKNSRLSIKQQHLLTHDVELVLVAV